MNEKLRQLDNLLTIREAAEYLGMSNSGVLLAIHEGRLKATRLYGAQGRHGFQWMISRADCDVSGLKRPPIRWDFGDGLGLVECASVRAIAERLGVSEQRVYQLLERDLHHRIPRKPPNKPVIWCEEDRRLSEYPSMKACLQERGITRHAFYWALNHGVAWYKKDEGAGRE